MSLSTAERGPSVTGAVSLALRGLIRGYQLVLSPLLGASCRYHPSCSAYAIEALDRHGPVKGGWLALKRLARCHPWGGAGVDPVPGRQLGAGGADR